MAELATGWGFTVAALLIITAVFAVALVLLRRELRFVRALTDYVGAELAGDRPSLEVDALRDGLHAARAGGGAPARELVAKQVRAWEMRAQRLEPLLAFWIDLLRQLGLLFTVVGLGLALAVDRGQLSELLAPLSLAVWTTVAGLSYSLVLSALFGMQVGAWADACEKNLEAWLVERG